VPGPRRSLTVVVLLAGLLVVPLVLGGCSSIGPNATGRGRVVQVVAAENMWGSIAAQLGGVHAEVVSIITRPATDPHDYEPTAADARTVAEAQEVIENGLGYDVWASKLVAADQVEGQRVLDVGQVLGLADGANPHRWYYPADVERVIDRISADYQRLDPTDAAYFAGLRQHYLTVGLAHYHQLLAAVRQHYAGTPVGASESIFEGLAQATGLRLTTPPSYLQAVSEGTDPTAGDRATVESQIDQRRIAVWVLNSQNATPDIQTLTSQARAHQILVTTITETLAPADGSFQDWQVDQLQSLARALAQGTGR
jgi:zinc/manganese transport system substrate-binding protein